MINPLHLLRSLLLLLLFGAPAFAAAPAWQWLEFPGVDAPPNSAVWHSSEKPWTPTPELGWEPADYTVLVMLAGVFRWSDGQDALLERIGRISALQSVKYWSVTDEQWNSLFDEASALHTAEASSLRADFTLQELQSGEPLFFLQRENRGVTGGVYRMRVASEPGRIVVTTENVRPLKAFMVPLMGAGEFQNSYILEQQDDQHWRFYSMLRAGRGDFAMIIGGHDSSFINRAAALYRHVSGAPTDAEPPLAPK
jgi:hypothetical protein